MLLFVCACFLSLCDIFLSTLFFLSFFFFFFNDTATTEIYTLSLHDALPISGLPAGRNRTQRANPADREARFWRRGPTGGAATGVRALRDVEEGNYRATGGPRRKHLRGRRGRKAAPRPVVPAASRGSAGAAGRSAGNGCRSVDCSAAADTVHSFSAAGFERSLSPGT